ncbi:MAG: hypothetical protein KGL34_09195 [Gammaproteobacteria bacterium]|nr:hypothetical protein [Gammaproteobacteria bacterium]
MLNLCRERPLDVARWRESGPAHFLAGLAVLVASAPQVDRGAWLALAEALEPGSTTVESFQQWLRDSPVRASRFLPMLAERMRE